MPVERVGGAGGVVGHGAVLHGQGFEREIPPPARGAVLPDTTLPVIVPPKVDRPPPIATDASGLVPDWLFETVLLSIVNGPSSQSPPPPAPLSLSDTTLFDTTVVVPEWSEMPPPYVPL